MIFHRLKEVRTDKEVKYKIELIERHWFAEKKLAEVIEGIEDEKSGNLLVEALDSGFKSGIKFAEMKTKQEIKT